MELRKYILKLTGNKEGTETSRTGDIERSVPKIEYHPRRRMSVSAEEEQAGRMGLTPHFYIPSGL